MNEQFIRFQIGASVVAQSNSLLVLQSQNGYFVMKRHLNASPVMQNPQVTIGKRKWLEDRCKEGHDAQWMRAQKRSKEEY